MMAIQSLRDVVRDHVDVIGADLDELMKLSRITDRFEKHGGAMVVVSAKPFRWLPLPPEGPRLQFKLRERYEEFIALVSALLDGQPPSLVAKAVESCNLNVLGAINQDEAVSSCHVDEAMQGALSALNLALSMVNELGLGAGSEPLLIPDTNALYAQTALEQWAFDGLRRFTLVLVPAVVTELDRHKDGDHRNPAIVAKAQKLVRQIGEYRRRGRLADGVPIARDRITLMSWAREPRVSETLGWLDEKRSDDRLLAGALEIARAKALAPVAIVTRDLNLQNRCELARVPFLAPPESAL